MTSVEQVKAAARGQWISILTAAGIAPESLNGKNGPCPKCGGTDRFAAFKDIAETGGVNCRKCHYEQNGDGIATLRWWLDGTFQETMTMLTSWLRKHQLLPAGNVVSRVKETYDYHDEAGCLLFQVVRLDPKGFRQRQPKLGGDWEWSVKGVRVVPYQLPKLLGDPTQPVFIVEGEKDADALVRIGLVATCNAGGAGKWTAEHSAHLRGRRVIVLLDNDEAGHLHAQQVAQSLYGIAESVRIVELPGLPDKGDVSDWLASGGTKDDLLRMAKEAPEFSDTQEQAWPEIASFDVLDLPPFPTDSLPQVLRNWVSAESHATQTPADLAGMLALAVCSAGIARRVTVEPRPGWHEPVNLFVAVLLEPGNRKSAVFADALEPLREFEDELIETARPDVARRLSERRQAECRLQRLEKLAAEKDDAEARHEAGNLAAELAQQVSPVLPRWIVEDATAEKLGIMLAEQGGRIASMSPEGSVFDLMAGLYGKGGVPQFGVYLMGHSGDDLTTDRVGRESVRVKKPALTCAYAMQPAVVEGLARYSIFRGRGLLARFLYAAPTSWLGQREIDTAPVADAVRAEYRQTVRQLAMFDDNCTLQLAIGASELFRRWESEIETMLADGGPMEFLRDWGAKLAGATLRIAAVVHCVEHGVAGFIEVAGMQSAIRIARYLVPHALATLRMMSASEGGDDDDARYVLRWVQRHRRQSFTKSEAQHHGKRRFPTADDIMPALNELARRGYIRLRPTEIARPGRPPSPTYEVNPAVMADTKPDKCSHNSRNFAFEPRDDDFRNNGSASGRSESANRVSVTI